MPATHADVRTAVLAASVLSGVDLTPTEVGMRLDQPTGAEFTWPQIAMVANFGPGHVGQHEIEAAHTRLQAWLRVQSLIQGVVWAADVAAAIQLLEAQVRVLALPRDHVLHGGPTWVQHEQLGGALDAGLGLSLDLDTVVPLTVDVINSLGIALADVWGHASSRLSSMTDLVVARLSRESNHYTRVLRPVGGFEVPALLCSKRLREFLINDDPTGMRAIAVPTRDRGWFDLARIDPAFCTAAWAATDSHLRGFRRALLLTPDEVAVPTREGEFIEALAGPGLDRPHQHIVNLREQPLSRRIDPRG